MLRSDERAVRLAAADRLGLLQGSWFAGTPATAAFGPLLSALAMDADADVAQTAGLSLGTIAAPPDAVAAWIQSQLAVWRQQGAATQQLATLTAIATAPADAATTPQLLEALLALAEAGPVRRQALAALTALGSTAAPAQARLVAMFATAARSERWHVAMALAAVGNGGQLEPALTSDDPRLRLAAAFAIWRDGSAVVPAAAVIPWLEDNRIVVQRSALAALPRLTDPPAAAVRTAARLLRQPQVQRCATTALQALGPRAAPALPLLRELLGGPDSALAWQVVALIGSIGPAAADAVPSLVEFALADADLVSNLYVIGQSLVSTSPARALPLLLAAFTKDRERAADAIWPSTAILQGMGPAAAVELPFFMAALDDPSPAVRWNTLRVLGSFGPKALPALPLVLRQLDDPDAGVLTWAAMAVRGIGPEAARTALPVLQRRYREVDGNRRLQLVLAAATFGAAAEPLLLEAVDDADVTVQMQVLPLLALLPGLSATGAERLSAQLDTEEARAFAPGRLTPWRFLAPPLLGAPTIEPTLLPLLAGKIDHRDFQVHLLAVQAKLRTLCPALALDPQLWALVAASDRAATKAALVDHEALRAWLETLVRQGDDQVRAVATRGRDALQGR